MNTTIKNCARCGGEHTLEMKVLSNHETYTHWAMCPETGQPILIEILQD